MKNKIIVIMSIVLVISIGLNFYFFLNLTENKKLVANADEQISDLQKQLFDLEKLQQELTDLQTQLADSKEEIKELENQLDKTITDDNTTFQGNGSGVDLVIPAEFPYVDREAGQEEVKQEEVAETPAPQQQPVQQPANTSAGLGNITIGDIPMGTGTGEGAIGSFGTFE